MNDNTSATGGFLLPLASPSPVPNDQDLENILQPWIVGLTGIDGTLVRPLWQEDPPPRPERQVNWISFGVKSHGRWWNSHIKHVTFENEDNEIISYDEVLRNEELDLTCSCYGPNADATSAALWNGAQVAQNREYLIRNSLFFVSVEDPITVPEKIKQRWVRRVDQKILLRRAVCLRYPVESLVEADISLQVPYRPDAESPTTIPVVVDIEGS
jgi:hypothetical protein